MGNRCTPSTRWSEPAGTKKKEAEVCHADVKIKWGSREFSQ
ncbi:hypothetical protein Enr13x_65210 [Stieleria neptunia]|uniref:Uncharacterized protein n=1 Tax=Stieleria neptunia TaxID=2527979 RepID=A0A518I0J2_9BACT|nr:hypothetical protein Enr13x_65210 [Stieleria neptunia]